MASRLALLALAGSALAQHKGTMTPEVHPKLTTWQCDAKGCTEKATSLVIDSDYRWMHTTNGTDNCKPNGLDKALCPDAKTCAANCVLEGVDYAQMGIATTGGELTLNLFKNSSNGLNKPSPRVYLLANDTHYDMFSMLNREITFDVDVSKLPCGTNGALYFSEMLPDGGRSDLNPAGATYGTGYCDAQCPTPPFINGEVRHARPTCANLVRSLPEQANTAGHGSCCNEMDMWEANREATAFTPHPCNTTAVYKCSGDLCGNKDKYAGVCDKDGCDFNAYRLGQRSFYQPNKTMTVDTTKPMTVVTQFITTTGDDKGDLREIRRIYLQDGKIIENAIAQVPGVNKGNSITDEYCDQKLKAFGGKSNFVAQGAMKGMGEALRRGMVLIFSVWDDVGSSMKWLDSTTPDTADPDKVPGAGRGPCPITAGKSADIMRDFPDTQVRFFNVKSGTLGSTFKAKTE
jgi:cellulose 1,4-beta-cellobiosidase